MPSFEHQGARIYYEEFGQGFPILTFAPAGLQSVIAVWSQPSAPINPTTEWAANYRVIAMDQRNAGGQSRAPITAQDGWDAYTADHIALLDHLRIDRCHLYGQCIGGSFILNLIKAQPERVQSAVLAQPIGRVGAMAPGRPARFNGWAETLKDHAEATPQVLDAFCRNLYAPGFVYCVDRAFWRWSARRAWCQPAMANAPYPDLRQPALPTSSLRVGDGPALRPQRPRVKKFLASTPTKWFLTHGPFFPRRTASLRGASRKETISADEPHARRDRGSRNDRVVSRII
jgi:pimeloyl-ACP methyl ester carboxylesterase